MSALGEQVRRSAVKDKGQSAPEKSEEGFRRLVQSNPDAILVQVAGKIVFANAAMLELVGAAKLSQICGRSVFEIVHPENRLAAEERLSRILETEQAGPPVREKWIRLDRSIAEVESVTLPVTWQGVTGVQVVARDIAHRLKRETALRNAEERLQTVVENLQDCAVFSVDPHGRITSWNIGAERAFGYAESEIIDQDTAILFTPEDQARGEPEKELTKAIESGRADEERWQMRKDGTRFNVSSVLTASRDEAGHLLGFTKLARNISSRKQSEEALRQSEARFRQLADTMPQMVWTARPDGHLDYYNKKWFEFTGFTEKDTYLSQGWLAIIHPDDVAMAMKKWVESVRTGGPFEAEYRFKSKEPGIYRWHLGRALPVKDTDGRVIRWFGTYTDIDDKKRTEEALREAKEEISHHAVELEKRVAQRTAELEEANGFLEMFSYGVAHDLRAPLRAMQSFAAAMLEDYAPGLDPIAQDYLQRIAAGTERMDQLIRDLLAYGRLTHVEIPLTVIGLEEVVDSLLAQLAEEIKTRNAEVQVRRPLPQVCANPIVLEQTLSNLIRNALKFVEPGVAPRVQIEAEE